MSRYELLERIGAGGMAEIFRGKAVAAGGFEKPVAIKRILPHLSQDERFVELLISEAKILSRLRHRNIVQIYDVGLAEDGQYFLVMEFVDGSDLGRLYQLLERKHTRMPCDVALHIGAEVCEALDHAHRALAEDGQPIRLVHRDVSPSNVLLSRSGEVKLTDFGIAKSIEEATGHGGVRGKFAYISPEQARNIHVDGRSDEYALAIIIYELLTGRRLYSGMADFDALSAARDPKSIRMREVDPSIPVELEQIFERALAPSPEDRYPTAGEFGSALRTFRYSMDETSGDPAKAIADYVQELWLEDEDEDDSRTVMRSIPFGEADTVLATARPQEDEETKAISILGNEPASITFSALPVLSITEAGVEVGTMPAAAMGKRAGNRRDPRAPMAQAVESGAFTTRAETPAARAQDFGAMQRAQHPGAAAHPAGHGALPLAPPQRAASAMGRPVEQLTPPPPLAVAVPHARALSWRMLVGLAVLAAVIALAAFFVAGKLLKKSSGSTAGDAAAETTD